IYLSNPNNPTGTYFTADALDRFLTQIPADVLAVLDEAYWDYVEAPDYSRSLDLVRRGANVFVLRTFSKVYGLAGIRIGYGLGPKAIINEIDKFRAPFNTSGVAQAAAIAALDDAEHVRRTLDSNRAGMKQITTALDRRGIRYVPSVCNFLLIELGVHGQPVADELMHRGVIVRPMEWMGFPNAIRVTVGTQEENEKFLNALDKVTSPINKVSAELQGRASD
ncbi:MAG: aminotransferase class I/II-fold pyridoxal phosphate-dependent enzyme, partial [Acidobacteria bacterium]|nr:aminotransferase class I/II-fold pyridoxal phosphate-dependent enzyme [Acidobacteriota bacterium]